MLKKYIFARFTFILGVFLLCAQSAFAIDEWYKALPLLGSLGQIKKDSVITVQDNVFFDPSLKPNQTTYGVKNYLSLKINEANGVLLPANFSITIHFKLYAIRADANGNQYIDSTSLPDGYPYVNITYNKGGIYNNKSVYTFNSAYRAQLKITSIDTMAGVPFNSYAAALMIENEMLVSREYNFSCTNNVITSVNTDASYLNTKGELRVSWAKDKMADEYDLEWAYVDQSALSGDSTNGAPDPRKIFTNNASRVSITKEEYFIPLLYDNTGTLFYRVRPVQIKYSGQRVEAKWSSDWVSTGLGRYVYNGGHEPTLNWQATTSFAEEGKRKSVVQYYDGSLRSRQTVTKDNTTDTTIVAETMYDYQGRPVIQVLPAPSLSSMIKYSPNFNTDINNAEYDKNKFDDVLTNTNYCATGAPAMSAQSGSSNYYSPFNPNKNNGVNRYIPDAKGYPFAETRYTQDNTGRISKQGGVGFDHQIGRTDTVYNDSHETKYYYGSADQEDLDALFGSEAGNASHYFKNMVRDANGQYSVSYVDMHGRTIATALAGKPAASLDTLQSSRLISITKKLIDSVNNIKKGTAIESSKSLVVTRAGSHSFNYSLNADSLQLNGCTPSPVCYDCLYNLTITITDDCNNESLPGNQPYIISDSNFTIGHVDTLCNAPVGFSKSFSLALKEGTYLVTKKLSISKYGMDYYRDSLFLIKNTCKTLDNFITQQKQLLLNVIDCAPSCIKCSIDTFRTWTLYRPYYMKQVGLAPADTAAYQAQALAAYNNQLQACNDICGNTTVANSIRRQMLADVSPPFGQYANPDKVDENSIFASSPSNLPKKYRYNDIDNYAAEDGRLDTLFQENGTYILPKNMIRTDFVSNFKTSWADSLLRLHPEYCKLSLYESNPSFTSSHLWDIQFESINTYQEAKNLGYLNPLGYTNVLAQPSSVIKDPFFDNAINPVYANTWRTVLNDSMRMKAKYTGGTFLDMWSLATAMATCDTGTTACYTHYSGNLFPFDTDTSCRGTLDMAWRYFQRMYKAEKAEIINKILAQACNAGINIDETKHTLNFPDQSKLDQGTASTVKAGNDSLTSLINNSCSTYATQWWNDLAPCNYTSADSAIIFPRLVKVCKEGGDIDHPFGSSTVKPGSSNYYRSFAEVINAYNDSLRTSPSHRNILASQCNAYIISSPAAFDNRPAYSNQEVWSKPDSCQCTVISNMYRQYQLNGGGDASFSAYLSRTAGTQMSNASLDSLRNLCSGAIVCKFLVKPIVVAPALQCGVKDVCASCNMVSTVYSKFKSSFPGVNPAYNAVDSLQRANNILFERFMNYNLGFSKQTAEYLTFIDTCNASGQLSKCDSLKKILTDYRSNDFRIKHLDASGVDTTNWKIDFGGSFYTAKVPLGEIFKNGIAQLPSYYADTLSVKHVDFDFYNDSLCVDSSGFTFETRIKLPDSLINPAGFNGQSVWLWLYGNQPAGWILGSINPANGQGVAVCTHADARDPLIVCAADNVPGQHLNNWSTVKFKLRGRNFSYYINDTLLAQRTLDYPITKLYGWTFTQYATKLAIDYIRIYDTSGNMKYQEEFNTAYPLAYPSTTANCNCQQNFASYFNQKRNTSYTYSQIDSVYNTCSVVLAPCADSTASKLEKYRDEFVNNYYNYGRKYDANGCDTMTWKVDYGPLINQTGVAHNKIFHDGVMQFPDTLGKAPNTGRVDYDFEVRDSACVNGRFSIEYRIKDPVNPLSATHGMRIEFFSGLGGINTRKYYLTFNSLADAGNSISYYDYNSAQNSRSYGSVAEFRQDYSYWRVVKFEMVDSVVNFYVDGVKLKTLVFPVASAMPRIYGLGLSSLGDKHLSAAFDWIKMYDGNGQVFYNEDFSDCSNSAVFAPYIECPRLNCSDAFTNYYNKQKATSYSFTQIDSIYRRYGVTLGICQSSSLTLCGRSAPVFPPVLLKQYSPCDDSTNFAVTTATMRYQAYKDSLNDTFNDKYLARCLNAYKTEVFTVTQPMSEFHYTLYYYDQAGNLVRTVPPEGVDMSVFGRTNYFDSVKTARNNGTVYKPKHGLMTDYRYNALNQVIAQTTPDAGLSSFWYDRLGRLVISQNARQKAASATENNRQYSYTTYDYLGRINEVGQVNNTTANGAMTDAVSRKGSSLDTWMLALTNKKEQVTRTYYDLAYPYANAIPLTAANLRNRVAYTTITNDYSTTNFNAGTFYSYDIHGNVDTLLQDYGASTVEATKNIMNRNSNRWERMVYKYDLISGKVNHVAYNPRYFDVTTQAWVNPVTQFYHRYNYDAENRLTSVETSADSIIWEKDARYEYYKHGPLARMIIGDQQVQALDYAYTVQGWLKGVNSTSATTVTDMGEDGKTGGQNINIARDIAGYSLNYFGGDYSPINTGYNPFPNTSGPLTGKTAYRPLYNGNISSMAVNIKPFNQPFLYNYKYDQLNRLTGMDAFTGLDTTNNNWTALTATKAYNERVSYDGNGNIKKYNRYFDVTSTPMDSLSYNYTAGTNKLSSVTDLSQGWVNANKKIKNQVANNYAYDEIGNLVKDSSEYIPTNGIKWNVYGKITEINHSQAGVTFNTRKINYYYDAAGNRIGKKVTKFGSANVAYTWYVRDAQGNVMNVYTAAKDTTAADTTLSPFNLVLTESHIYGSSRMGVFNQTQYAEPPNTQGGVYYNTRGARLYELTNHLGNVLAVISDKKIGHTSNGTTLDYYNPDVVMATDYYPFGMQSRFSYLGNLSLGYRYSFNGKENDGDVKGDGNQIDYGARVYDPRLGRFLSLDPLMRNYPYYSPYHFSGNNPVRFVDLDGQEVANPSIFRKSWNYLVGDYHLNRMNSYLTENQLTSDNVIELNNETSVVYQVRLNAATGNSELSYSIFRKAREGRICLLCIQSNSDDDIGLSEKDFLSTKILSDRVLDAPIGLGAAPKALILLNGAKNSTYSFRQTVGIIKNNLRALGNWKEDIGFGKAIANTGSSDLLKKGFHLHFNNLKGLELGLTTTDEGRLAVTWIRVGEKKFLGEAIKTLGQAMANPGFKATLISKLKMSEEALNNALKFYSAGSAESDRAKSVLKEIQNVLKSVDNYGKVTK